MLRLAAPLVLSFWMRAAVTFVDTIYAAFLGDAAVAAVGLTVPIEFVMLAVWAGLSTGLTSALARAMGAGGHAQIEQYLKATWHLVALASPLFTLAGAGVWLATPHLSLSTEVAQALRVYGAVLVGGSAFTTFWSVIPDSLVKAHHDTRSTMWAGIWTNTLNLGLNTLFMFVFHWGVLGIALSTVLGRLGGLVYALGRARVHERRRQTDPTGDRVTRDPAPFRAVLRLAVPSSLTFALMATEAGIVNTLLAAARHPTEAIAAYSIYYRLMLFAFQPVIATSVALLPYAARLAGEGDFSGIRRGLRQALVANAFYATLVVAPILLFLAPWIAGRLAESPLTAEYTRFALRAVPLACLAGAPFLLCRPVFEAMQQGRPGLLLAGLRYLLLTGPLAWLGLHAAAWFEQPELYGVIAGCLAAAAMASVVFQLWLRRSLPG